MNPKFKNILTGVLLFLLIGGTFYLNNFYLKLEDKQTEESAEVLGAFSWPGDLDWNIISISGNVYADFEERASCSDTTKGANPSGPNDLGSQADCSGPAPHYNPGNAGQPGWTPRNTYTAGNFTKMRWVIQMAVQIYLMTIFISELEL